MLVAFRQTSPHGMGSYKIMDRGNPSNVDTIGMEESVLIREVSSFKGLNCM